MEDLLIEEVIKSLNNDIPDNIIKILIGDKEYPFKIFLKDDKVFCESTNYSVNITLQCNVKDNKLNGLCEISELGRYKSVHYCLHLVDNVKDGILTVSVHQILTYCYENGVLRNQ